MEENLSSPASANARKRPAEDDDDSPAKKPLNLKGTQFVMPSPPDTDSSNNASPTFQNGNTVREVSPAPSSTTLSSITSSHPAINFEGTSTTLAGADAATTSSAQPPKKRRKLTPSERIEQQREKDTKAAEKAVERARKLAEKERKDMERAEEKTRKDEEKRMKDEEKRKKAEEKEEKKREKEIQDEQKVQEKLKKERSQMRLGAFFQKPATPIDEPGLEGSAVRARRKSLSLEPFDAVADQIRRSESPCKKAVQALIAEESTASKPILSDYHKYFLPFQIQTYTTLAPSTAPSDLDGAQETFDYQLEDQSIREKYDLGLVDEYASLERQFANERLYRRGRHLPSLRQLVDQINGSSDRPIDLTEDASPQDPIAALRAVSLRHISFQQDERPAYFGTYTKIRSPRTMKKMSRHPFMLARPDTDYDYDSEAEWEAPEDGEELLDEEDEEAESIGDANEMDEFLDDEEDALKNKRKLITGDLVPTNTGICWEDEASRMVASDAGGNHLTVMRGMRMGVLLPNFQGQSIDPFSTSYWESEIVPLPTAGASKTEGIVSDELMPPPRQPLQPRSNANGTLDRFVGGETAVVKPQAVSPQTTKATRVRGAQTTLSKEDMEEFKGFVIGSQAQRPELLKQLKARFPKFTNDAIKTTLTENFAQIGSKADKKWGFVSVS